MKGHGKLLALFVALLVWASAASAQAHEFRVASAELHWQGRAAALDLHVPPGSAFDVDTVRPTLTGCTEQDHSLPGRWRFACAEAGPGALRLDGLSKDGLDVFVRATGPQLAKEAVLGPTTDTLVLDEASAAGSTMWSALRARVVSGFTHILEGWDHLLFLLALVSAIRTTRARLFAITAFTIGHSATLALAGMDLVRVPGPLVESLVALSIVVVAASALRDPPPDDEATTPAWRHGLVPGSFGLLHGFAFAGALGELGVEGSSRLTHLLGFNLGVEAGQLGVLLVAASLGQLLTRVLGSETQRRLTRALPWVAGTLGAAWWVERCLAFVEVGS